MAVIAACTWLTLWQLQRATDKEQLLARFHGRAVVELAALSAPLSLPQPVRLAGWWRPARQVLIDNRIREGQPGVEVLTPLELDDGRWVLIQRGWASWPARDQALPDPRPPQTDPGRPVQLTGVLNHPPGVGVRMGEATSTEQWPRLLTWFDLESLRAAFGPTLLPAVVQLDPNHPAHLTGDAWPLVTFGPERHRGYALTWATIALVVTGIWLVLSLRARRNRQRT
ncbi:MAG: SURF1 family protein [Wenzhouxiangellaceae bacterium]|nr:SURF1 family protein [Wenzhouxiangellaceae bacterium]